VAWLLIPTSFIAARTRLSRRELQYGVDRHYVLPQAATELAAPPPTEEPAPSDDDLRDKWLYLTLAWLHAQPASARDRLLAVEEVYSHFDYPEAIVGFVGYMPMVGPDLGSPEAHIERMMTRWQAYLDEAAPRWAP